MASGIDAALVVVLATALLALAASVAWAGRAVVRYLDRPEPVPASDPTTLGPSVTFENMRNLERRLDEFQLALADGIQRVDRAEKRIQKTVTSARRLVANAGLEHAGIEAEAAELRDVDAPDITPEPVPAVQEDLEPSGPSGIPGISQARLDELRGGGAGG